jgi:hypothetical protein
VAGLVSLSLAAGASGQEPLKLREVPCDLVVPQMTPEAPTAGKRVKHQLPEFAGTELVHALYLPTNWQRGNQYPVIFEYPGNGPYENKLGDTNSGRLEDCNLGYGISAGKDFIWVCLPFVDPQTKNHTLQCPGVELVEERVLLNISPTDPVKTVHVGAAFPELSDGWNWLNSFKK